MGFNSECEPSVPLFRLMLSLLLAGVTSGAVVGFAYLSLLLVAPLAGIGIPGTACLAAALLIKTEQATIFLLSRWRPRVVSLLLSALPGTLAAFVLRGLFDLHGLLGIVFAVTAGLVAQALALHWLMAVVAPRASEPEGPVAPEPESESLGGRAVHRP